MKTLTRFLTFGFVGSGIGACMMTLVILINGSKHIDVTELFYWIPASFLMGAVTMILYTDRLHFLLLTAIHFVSCFGIVFAAVHLCGYMDTPLASLRAMMPEFLIIYIGIFLAVYTVSKLNERAVNKALEKQL